ncbi:MAG: PmoA family protein [Kiritimatiellia bacterium]|nr:PmoA family protein [Kiritimatiellia bacterium]
MCALMRFRLRGFLTSAFLAGLLSTGCATAYAEPEAKLDLSWNKTADSVALLNGAKVVWQYNHKKAEGKPYFHPLGTIDGDVLTWLRPGDHRWHRAMWHSWKMLNGLNYWEENNKTMLSQGRTQIVDIKVETAANHSAEIKLKLIYHPPDKPEIMSEERTINISAPGKDGRYRVDWVATYKAIADKVTLERTPIPGQPGGRGYGGYAGLSIRMAKETRGWSFLNSEGLQGKAMHGKNATWVHASGKTVSGKDAGLTMLDHPSNMRHPSPWYLAAGMPYFSPALIFNEPYVLTRGQSFTLKYRVLVHSGPIDKDKLAADWREFSGLRE